MKYELDTEDAVTAGVFLLAVLSIVDITAVEFMSYSFSDNLTTMFNGDVVLSIGGALVLGIWGFVYATNDHDVQLRDGMESNYSILVIGSTLITAGLVLVDPVQSWFIAQHDLITISGPLASFAGLLGIGYYK